MPQTILTTFPRILVYIVGGILVQAYQTEGYCNGGFGCQQCEYIFFFLQINAYQKCYKNNTIILKITTDNKKGNFEIIRSVVSYGMHKLCLYHIYLETRSQTSYFYWWQFKGHVDNIPHNTHKIYIMVLENLKY